MMKLVLAAAAALMTLQGPALADTFFNGVLIITQASNCPNGPNVDDRDNAVFHPKAITGNENYSSLNLISQFGAHGRILPGQSFNATFKGTASQSIGWSDYIPDTDTFIRITNQIPASLTTTTPAVFVWGEIQNPWGDLGQENCIVAFNFSGIKN